MTDGPTNQPTDEQTNRRVSDREVAKKTKTKKIGKWPQMKSKQNSEIGILQCHKKWGKKRDGK